MQRLLENDRFDKPLPEGAMGRKMAPDFLRPWDSLFRGDYMGSSEYEFGVYSDTLRAILAESDRFVAFSVTLRLSEYDPEVVEDVARWVSRLTKGWKEPVSDKPPKVATVYVACNAAHRRAAEAFIRYLAAGKVRTRDGCRFVDATLFPALYRGLVGGLEETNGWLWLTKRDLFEKACKILGVTRSEITT